LGLSRVEMGLGLTLPWLCRGERGAVRSARDGGEEEEADELDVSDDAEVASASGRNTSHSSKLVQGSSEVRRE
jgi:hypothetical protein